MEALFQMKTWNFLLYGGGSLRATLNIIKNKINVCSAYVTKCNFRFGNSLLIITHKNYIAHAREKNVSFGDGEK